MSNNVFKLKNGSILLSTEAPGGIYNSMQLKEIASLCEEDMAIVKATEDQRLALFVPEEKAGSIAERLQAIGLGIRNYRSGLHQPTSCIGELCPDHKQDAQSAAMSVTEELQNFEISQPVRIGINGCEKCCVPCHTLDISVTGKENGYQLNIGGKNSTIAEFGTFVAEGIPEEQLPTMLKNILETYKKESNEDETLQDLIERQGSAKFISVLAPYSQDAADTSEDIFATEDDEEALEDVPEENIENLFEEETPASETKSESSADIEVDELEEIPASETESKSSADIEMDELEEAATDELYNEAFTEELKDEITDLNDTPSPSNEQLENLSVLESKTLDDSDIDIDPTEFTKNEVLPQDVLIDNGSLEDNIDDLSELSVQPDLSNEIDDLENEINTEEVSKDPDLSELDNLDSLENDMTEENLDDLDSPEEIMPEEDIAETPSEEINEETSDEESAFEDQITKEIEAHDPTPLIDEQAQQERLETLDSIDAIDEIPEVENIDIDETVMSEADEEQGFNVPDDESFNDLEAETDGLDELSELENIEEDFSDIESPEEPEPQMENITSISTAPKKSKSSFMKSIQFSNDRLLAEFSNGARVEIDPENFALGEAQSINIGDIQFEVIKEADGFTVQTDSIKLTLPTEHKAA